MLRLNYMLANRFFKKVGKDKLGREWWSRPDVNVYRYPSPDNPAKKLIQIDYIRNQRVVKSTTVDKDTEEAYNIIDALSYPEASITATTGSKADTGPSLEDITGRAMSAFDRWYSIVATDPDRDMVGDVISLSFGETEATIPLCSIAICEITADYLRKLHQICKEHRV